MLGEDIPTLHQGVSSFTKWVLNAAHLDNRATSLRLRHPTHEAELFKALEVNPHMGVVQAWTAQSAISPREQNIETIINIQSHNHGQYAAQVEGHELSGPLASHNSSNVPILIGFYVRRAMELGQAA
jgi:hypothetical protein